MSKWATTADKDGDLAIFEEDTKQLVGVAATVNSALAFVADHNTSGAKTTNQPDDSSNESWTDHLTPEVRIGLLKLIRRSIGKSWFEVWHLHDVCYLIRAVRLIEPCGTCKGTGYQGIIGAPGCQGGCEDCAGTGCDLTKGIK